ncbi:hypothetical protein D3C75_758990 [compost metagenome]
MSGADALLVLKSGRACPQMGRGPVESMASPGRRGSGGSGSRCRNDASPGRFAVQGSSVASLGWRCHQLAYL